MTYRLRRWPLYLVAFNPLLVLRLRLLPQVIGGGLFGSGQRAGRRSTHATQALKEEAQAIHAESVPVVYGYDSSEFARSGRDKAVAKVVRCPACGEVSSVPSCPSCGAELLTRGVGQIRDHPATDRDQTRHEQDQTWSDADQTVSDQDQTWSDHDQTASASDQRSANEDQHAADDDLAAGGDRATYDRSALARERSSRDRAAVSAVRDESAAARLRTAEERDQAATLRDRGAQGRDELARLHDLQDDRDASREDILLRAKRDRARAAADRAKAADDRTRAAADRTRAAADREDAARQRAEALRHRMESADDLRFATTDELTGAWTRRFGLEEVSRELERAHRTGASLVLAFIDVDGLKQVNDTQGHLAGDTLLRLVGETLRANVRPYDVIVRYGGDELLCAMPNLSAPDARARFEKIAAVLTAADAKHSVTFGLAEAEPADSLQELIARADADLLEARHSGQSNG